MTKRLIRILALILVLVSALTIHVSAAEMDGSIDSFINLMEYGSIGGTGSNYVSVPANGSFTFDLDTVTNLYYIDMTVRITGSVPTAVKAKFYTTTSTLTITSIAGNLYRIYGNLTSSYGDDQITFNFTSSSTSRVTICGFRASVGNYVSVSHKTNIIAERNNVMYEAAMSSAGSTASISLPTATGSPSDTTEDWDLYVYAKDWVRFDYVDIALKLQNVCEINSVAVQFNGKYVPFTLSMLDVGLDESVRPKEVWETAYDGFAYEILSYYDGCDVYVTMRLDLTDLRKTDSGEPVVRIFGKKSADEVTTLTLLSYDGIVSQEGVSFEVRLMTLLRNQFSSFTSAFSDQTALLREWYDAQMDAFGNLDFSIGSYFSALGDQLSKFQSKVGDWFSTTHEKLDTIIGSGTEGDELQQGSQDLESTSQDIHDFEQSHMGVLDSNISTIQNSVKLTGFTSALAFVQNYANMVFSGIPDYIIVYSLPLFLGLFFYICSRVPGATRWRSRPPKGGDSG